MSLSLVLMESQVLYGGLQGIFMELCCHLARRQEGVISPSVGLQQN